MYARDIHTYIRPHVEFTRRTMWLHENEKLLTLSLSHRETTSAHILGVSRTNDELANSYLKSNSNRTVDSRVFMKSMTKKIVQNGNKICLRNISVYSVWPAYTLQCIWYQQPQLHILTYYCGLVFRESKRILLSDFKLLVVIAMSKGVRIM